MRPLIVAPLAACVFLLAPAFAGAASVTAFVGPQSWSHAPQPSSADGSRTVDQWRLSGDIQTVTFIHDAGASYATSLAAMQKNFSENHIKPSIDKDSACHGQTAHVVEFTIGPDGHRVTINRTIVPDAAGIDSITYTRSDGDKYDDDVKTAVTAYCGAT